MDVDRPKVKAMTQNQIITYLTRKHAYIRSYIAKHMPEYIGGPEDAYFQAYAGLSRAYDLKHDPLDRHKMIPRISANKYK